MGPLLPLLYNHKTVPVLQPRYTVETRTEQAFAGMYALPLL